MDIDEARAGEGKRRPNILLIVCDQLRYDCVGSSLGRPVKTPHMDAIARGGVRFLNAFTPQPLCCPARQSLLTSRRPERDGFLWNHDIALKTYSMAPGERLWPVRLSEAGYRTAYVGKWHESATHSPTAFGYDIYDDDVGYAAYRKSVAGGAYGNTEFTKGIDGEIDPVPVEYSHTHWLARQACRRLDELAAGGGRSGNAGCRGRVESAGNIGSAKNAGNGGSAESAGCGRSAESAGNGGLRSRSGSGPWHLRVDFTEPHPPYQPSPEFACMYDPAAIPPWDSFNENFSNKPYIQKQMLHTWGIENYDWERWAGIVARYFAVISQLDDAIGLILNALARTGLADDTLVVLTPDHGDMCGAHRMVDKHNVLYDDITHVPLLMRWPRVLPAGQEIGEFVYNTLDIGPTLLAVVGLPLLDAGLPPPPLVDGLPPPTLDDLPPPPLVDGSGRGGINNREVVSDGCSLFPLLKSEKFSEVSFSDETPHSETPSGETPRNDAPPHWRDCVVSTYNGQQFGLYTQRMIRDTEWKYIWNTADIDELYCLRDDPAELINRVYDPSCGDILRKMRRRLHDVLINEGDGLLKSHWMRDQLMGKTKKL